MSRQWCNLAWWWIILTVLAGTVGAREVVLQPVRVSAPPVIDGVLNDAAWTDDPLVAGNFATYNPMYGQQLPQRTLVWAAYDSHNLYLAFRCLDSEPERIKTSLGKHDSMFSDDWVGFFLDPLNNRQTAYEFFVNPSGVQGDIYNTVANGEDSSPDWVWYSAARITDQGYEVEVAIPLRSIRYRSGDQCRMGILFWRRISRLGVSGAWPGLIPGKGIFAVQAPIVFEELASPHSLEVLPSVTYSLDRSRENDGPWDRRKNRAAVGVGVKYALTSTIDTELTINPDFSQVESDAFQVEVNQRYPLYVSEKRPFFMETMGIFNLAATGGDNWMGTAVHTRTIVDPDWGGKVTGDAGPLTFGILTAADAWPGRITDDGVNPFAGQTAKFLIGRGMVSLGDGSYVGMLYTDREFGDGFNRVIGGDTLIRFHGRHTLASHILASFSRDDDSGAYSSGVETTTNYSYNSQTLSIWGAVEHFQPGFRMDTAFYRRTGYTKGTFYLGPQLNPQSPRLGWLKNVNPFVFGYVLHDSESGLNDRFLLGGIRLYLTRQGFVRFDVYAADEGWAGRLFAQHMIRFQARSQLTNWLYLGGSLNRGRSLYYDEEDPFVGPELSGGLDVTIQPNRQWKQTLGFTHVRLNRPDSDRTVYRVNIVNSQTTFQLNRRFFLRATFRGDSYRRRLLTDFLAAYTYIPGTVMYLGYGSVYGRDFEDATGRTNWSGMIPLQRSLFFKVSYRWQM